MKTSTPTIDSIVYYNAFGCITNFEVILYNKKNKEKIDFESINNIRLIKERVFYYNLLFFVISLLLFYIGYLFYTIYLTVSLGLSITAGLILLYSYFYKFYFYKMIIKEKNNKIYEIKTSQNKKEDIKKLYNYIANKIKKHKNQSDKTKEI
jgi:hypothetical protein